MLNKQPVLLVFHQLFSVLPVMCPLSFCCCVLASLIFSLATPFAGIEFHFLLKEREKVVAKTTPKDSIALVTTLVFSYFVILSLCFDPFPTHFHIHYLCS